MEVEVESIKKGLITTTLRMETTRIWTTKTNREDATNEEGIVTRTITLKKQKVRSQTLPKFMKFKKKMRFKILSSNQEVGGAAEEIEAVEVSKMDTPEIDLAGLTLQCQSRVRSKSRQTIIKTTKKEETRGKDEEEAGIIKIKMSSTSKSESERNSSLSTTSMTSTSASWRSSLKPTTRKTLRKEAHGRKRSKVKCSLDQLDKPWVTTKMAKMPRKNLKNSNLWTKKKENRKKKKRVSNTTSLIS